VEVMEGDPRNVLCEAVDKYHASMLAVGSHGYGAIKRYIGSFWSQIFFYSFAWQFLFFLKCVNEVRYNTMSMLNCFLAFSTEPTSSQTKTWEENEWGIFVTN